MVAEREGREVWWESAGQKDLRSFPRIFLVSRICACECGGANSPCKGVTDVIKERVPAGAGKL